MRDFLFQYEPVNPTTWVYLSSLLTIGLYFKFSRLWSMRNLDLLGLILLAPGLLLVYNGGQAANRPMEQVGLPLAILRRRPIRDSDAAGPDHGPPAAAGAESFARAG